MKTFTEKVYDVVRRIPKGYVATYGQVAKIAGYPNAARAVGTAMHKNPDPIGMPCYKVVNSQGKLAKGYNYLKGIETQKQFLENDRKVLRFNATFEGLKYIIHYYLSDDTVEIREVNYNNSGRYPFPLLLKRNRLPRRFCIPQPGEIGAFDFYTDADIEPLMTLWAFNRPFKILGCDEFTAEYYLKNYRRNLIRKL